MRSLYLGRAFGIPLYIHWTFALLPLYMLYVCWHEPIASLLLAEVTFKLRPQLLRRVHVRNGGKTGR